jgi:hypothetical protein
MRCTNSQTGFLVALALLALPVAKANGQLPQNAPAAQAVKTAQAAQTEAIDTAATAALSRMASYLSTLDAFQVKAVTTTELVLADGQKVTMSATADVLADRPNKLRLDIGGDRRQRLIVYDGANFTLWAPKFEYYATAPAPATLYEFVDKLEDHYNIELPLVDLIRWGSSGSRLQEITAASMIGPAQIEGVTCDQFIFRQDGLDWQIWIQRGDFPLPRKVILTTTTDDARPQFTAVYTWNLAPSFNDEAFTFIAPKGASRIPFTEFATTAETAAVESPSATEVSAR